MAPVVIGGVIAFAAWRVLSAPDADPVSPGSTASEEEPERDGRSQRERRERRKRGGGDDDRPRRLPGRPADFSDLARDVAEIRGLEIRDRLRARVTSDRALADKISELAQEDVVPSEVEADEQLLVSLRLAPPDIDLLEVLIALYREQILGVYVPEESTLYVKHGPEDLSPLGSVTAAHEITHALQDQHFDLDRMRSDVEDDADASLAVLALIEGDAVLTQQRWAAEHLSQSEIEDAVAEGAQTGGEALEAAPPYLRNGLFFPYDAGVQFVAEVSESTDIDNVFRDPPTTTEQILHPGAYLEGDEPETVSVARPGRGWRSSTNYEFGEFDVAELFSTLGAETAAEIGEGWDGGRVRSWSRGQDTAVAAKLAFDSPDDAAEACDALPRWYADVADGNETGDRVLTGDRDVMAYACAPTTVTFGLGPDEMTARRLAGG